MTPGTWGHDMPLIDYGMNGYGNFIAGYRCDCGCEKELRIAVESDRVRDVERWRGGTDPRTNLLLDVFAAKRWGSRGELTWGRIYAPGHGRDA